LVYRYNVKLSADGLTGEEGAFSMCTFWLVEALTRVGQVDRCAGYIGHPFGKIENRQTSAQ